jgi:hypothetical protein
MSRWVKVLIGYAGAIAAALVHYWPVGAGEAFISSLEAKAQRQVDYAATIGLPGVRVRMQRGPLARVAILSGNANEFQREGTSADPGKHRLSDYPGINDRLRAIPGIAAVRWEN